MVTKYDSLLRIIEDNVENRWEDVEAIITSEWHDSARNLGEFRRSIAQDDMTLQQYFRDRKLMRTLAEARNNHCAESDGDNINRTLSKAAEKYGYDEYTTFYRAVRAKYGRSPQQVIQDENYKCPEPFFIEDIVRIGFDGKMLVELDEYVKKSAEIRKLQTEYAIQIDKVRELQNEVSKLKKELREEKERERKRELLRLEAYKKGEIPHKVKHHYVAFVSEDMLESYYDGLEEYANNEMSVSEAWSEYYCDGESDEYDGYGDVDDGGEDNDLY